jgi:hypothetical protein
MNLGLALTLGFIVFMAAVIAAVIGALVYLDSGGEAARETTTTTASTATTTSSTASSTLPTSTTEPLETSSTSTTLELRAISLTYSPEKLYLHDKASLEIKSGGEPLMGASIYLDGQLAIPSNNGDDQLPSLEGGPHKVTAVLDGYASATINITVEGSTYSHSPAVRGGLTPEERRSAISEGKADLRFYENPGCIQCITVLNYLNKIVDKNRQCMVFERLNVWNPTSNKEAQALFGKDTVLSFPLIVVDGQSGQFKTQGIVSADAIRDMVTRASGCSVQ